MFKTKLTARLLLDLGDFFFSQQQGRFIAHLDPVSDTTNERRHETSTAANAANTSATLASHIVKEELSIER